MPDIWELLDSRTKRLEGQAYKLVEPGRFGLDTSFDKPDVDVARMSVKFPFASGQRRDGVGDLLEIGGIRLDRHRLNPVCLYDHAKSVSLPIAKALDPDSGEYTVHLDTETQTAWVKAFFYNGKGIDGVEKSKEYDHALFCEQLFDLIAKGFVRAGSIGYQVIKGLHLPADPAQGTPPGLHLISVLMLEASAVVMPANQDTVMKALALSSVCGKPMSPILYKSLQGYAGDKKVQMGYEGKSTETVPVPLEKLPDTQIPPAVWKPGAGASKADKAVRTEYGIINDFDGALQDSIRAGVRIQRTSIPPYNAIVVGEMWRVDDFLNKWGLKSMTAESKGAYEDGYRARLASKDAGENPHKEGDGKTEWHKGWEEADKDLNERKQQKALRNKYLKKAVKWTPGNDETKPEGCTCKNYPQVKMRNGSGHEIECPYHKSWQEHGGFNRGKSLDLRKKYRPVKNLRHKLKSGSPGAAIVHIGEKDMVEARQFATSRGIKFAHLGTGETGLARVKLIGDDGGIDEFAKHYGRRLKSTAIQETKNMSSKNKTLTNTNKKSADDAPVDSGTDSSSEKWGAQMMRRAHEDHGILMKDYDDMMGVLEDDEIHKHFTGHMSNMAKFLDDTEKLWEKKYKDHGYEPLVKDLTEDEAEDVADELVDEAEDTEEDDVEEDSEGEVEDKDADTMDDNAVPATDSEEEVPDPDEVVEGMKGLNGKEIKTLKKKYNKIKSKKKSVCAECGKEDCKCGTKDLTEEELQDVEQDLENQAEDTEPKSLQPHEHTAVGEAAGFLREKSTPDSMFGEEDRFKSYHYHKTLEGIGQVEDMAADSDVGTKAYRIEHAGTSGTFRPMPDKYDSLSEAVSAARRLKNEGYGVRVYNGNNQLVVDAPWQEDIVVIRKSAPDMTTDIQPDPNIDGVKSHRKACGEASQFFKALACTKDFGDKHRQGAAHYADVLEGVVGKKDENTMNPDAGTHQGPGAVAGKELEETVRRNGDRINALLKVMQLN